MNEPSLVRRAAVAGTFYSDDPGRLRTDIDLFLADVQPPHPAGRPIVLLAPHAGYAYSGHVAAHGYKLIDGLDLHTVILVGPSHVEQFPFISVFSGAAYETPLGMIQVNHEMSEALVASSEHIQSSPRGHYHTQSPQQEHALEVQLPFLQSVLGEFRIVPVIMGSQSWELCEVLGRALSPWAANDGVLIVASSDLSHFYEYDTARRLDARFCELLQTMDAHRLYRALETHDCEACGAGPVVASLLATREIVSASCQLLKLANSGDVSGEHDRVVGYASAAILVHEPGVEEVLDQTDFDESTFGEVERAYLLRAARRAVEADLGIKTSLAPSPNSPVLDEHRGAFITLRTAAQLRGCIGYLSANKPLRHLVPEMAVAAASHDPRFTPLTAAELPNIHIEISVLSPLRRILDPNEIEIGRDGLVVEKGSKRGLLLPQVAVEHGWDTDTFLRQTCTKADLPEDTWRHDGTLVYIFSATVFGEESRLAR